jgi:SAM-dependent methyltransferase
MPERDPEPTELDDPIARLERFVATEFDRADVRDVLDAGCGFSLPFEFPAGLRFVGLDASPEALAKNTYIESGVVGDVESYRFPEAQFDAVLCWTVLEHLAHPRRAVENMAWALRPGGLLIVGVPNPRSLKGIVTRLTPHRFHVWVYRHLLRYPGAGTPGFGPYPTYLRSEIAPENLQCLARSSGLERIYAETYALGSGLPPRLDRLWSVALALGRLGSLGRWEPGASDHLAVFRKVASTAVA